MISLNRNLHTLQIYTSLAIVYSYAVQQSRESLA